MKDRKLKLIKEFLDLNDKVLELEKNGCFKKSCKDCSELIEYGNGRSSCIREDMCKEMMKIFYKLFPYEDEYNYTFHKKVEKVKELSEQMTVNSTGGKQHKVLERYEAGFPFAEDAVARLRAEGHDIHGYEDDNYLKIPASVHVARAKRHITKWQMGDTEDGTALEHLVHAICRLDMAYTELLMEAKEQPKIICRMADWNEVIDRGDMNSDGHDN